MNARSLFTAIFFLSASIVQAAPTTLDTSFGTNGVIGATITPDVFNYGAAMDRQSDGKLVVAGSCYRPALGYTQFCVWRFRQDGASDAGFGSGGVVKIDFPGLSLSQGASSLTVQPDGKIVIAGVCDIGVSGAQSVYQFCAARLLPAGGLDTQGFGTGGQWRGRVMPGGLKSDERLTTILAQPDGKIVLLGTCLVYGPGASESHLYACHTRLRANGQPDASYTAEPIENIGTLSDFGVAAVLKTDGKIVLAGRCRSDGVTLGSFDFKACIGQLNASGDVDSTFGSRGFSIAADPPGQNMTAVAIAIQGGGNLIVAGQCYVDPSRTSACLRRWNVGGDPDTAFPAASASIITTLRFTATKIAAQGDGKIVVAGTCEEANQPAKLCVARHHANGERDTQFTRGIAELIALSGRPDLMQALVAQSDGKIVLQGVCGVEVPSSGYSVCLARLVGGPNEFSACSGDVDGDGEVTTSDSLIFARVALGFTETSVTQNVAFAAQATRRTWPLIRDYLANHCRLRVGRS